MTTPSALITTGQIMPIVRLLVSAEPRWWNILWLPLPLIPVSEVICVLCVHEIMMGNLDS